MEILRRGFPIREIRFWLAVLLGLAPGLVLAGCHSAPRLTPQQAEGKRLYAGRCAHCHEENDLNLKKVPPDLHRLFKHAALPGGASANDAEVARVVLTGKGMMPGFAGRFSNEQMAALIAYLHTGLQ
jgi:mono/diheme cytochrome c family protein